MSNQKVTFKLKTVETVPLKISIVIGPTIQGSITGHAIVRSKPEIRNFFERVEAGEFKDNDKAMLQELYKGFDGLENEEGVYCEGDMAFDEILTGKFSSYLTPAVIQAYYDHYGEARQGNFKGPRAR